MPSMNEAQLPRRCSPCDGHDGIPSNGRQRLAEARHAVAVLPLAAGLENRDAFETLEDIALGAGGSGGRTKTAMLRHNLKK